MPPKILVVDDDPIVIRMVKSFLATHGFEIVWAADGLDALIKIKKEKPQLVILDIMMPEVNGYDVCYQLRFNPDFEKIPIIILTVREKEIDDLISKRSNIDYVQKPVDLQLLLTKVQSYLGKEEK